jgi:hypothetical protein
MWGNMSYPTSNSYPHHVSEFFVWLICWRRDLYKSRFLHYVYQVFSRYTNLSLSPSHIRNFVLCLERRTMFYACKKNNWKITNLYFLTCSVWKVRNYLCLLRNGLLVKLIVAQIVKKLTDFWQHEFRYSVVKNPPLLPLLRFGKETARTSFTVNNEKHVLHLFLL